MKDRILILFFLLTIVLIIILFIVSKSFFSSGKKYSKKVNYTDKEFEKRVEYVESGKITGKYETNDKNKAFYYLEQEDRDKIDSTIDSIVSMLNEKDAETLYKQISYGYKNALFPNINEMKNYLDKILSNNEKFEVVDYNVTTSDLVINLSKTASKKTDFMVRVSNYKDYDYLTTKDCLVFNGAQGIDNLELFYSNDKVRFESDYGIRDPDKYSIVLNIINLTEKEINIDFKNTKISRLLGGNEKLYSMYSTRYVTVPASGDIIYEMSFKRPDIDADSIRLNMTIDDQEYNETINFITEAFNFEDNL